MKKHKPSEKMPAPSRHVVIKFKGDDLDWHRAFFGPLAKDFILWGDYSISADQIEWWADPLEEEAQEPQQPDGYCAWHPGTNFLLETADKDQRSTHFKLGDHMKPVSPEDRVLDRAARALRDGWRIRPVKITGLDKI